MSAGRVPPAALATGGLVTGILLSVLVLLGWFSVLGIMAACALGAAVAFMGRRVWPADVPAGPSGSGRSPAPWRMALVPALPLAFLLASYAALRTGAALASPWQRLPATLLPLYGLGFWALLLASDALPVRLRGALTGVMVLAAVGVSLIVYGLGFGFDPFIHQAAERYLADHGHIHLPSPLYVGQYAVVAALARLTALPVGWIDRALVPLLAAGIAVLAIPKGLRAWMAEAPAWAPPVWLLFPFLPLTFTVPHHLAYLLFFCGILFLPVLSAGWGLVPAGLLTAYAALVHPLLAIPLASLVAAAAFARRRPAGAGVLAFALAGVGLAAAFAIYVRAYGGSVAPFSWAGIGQALHIVFGFPYDDASWPWWVRAAYRAWHVWPAALLAIGLAGTVIEEKTRRWAGVLLGTAAGMAAAAVFLAGWVRFHDILSTEQYEFALRLRYAIPLLGYPGVVLALRRAHGRIDARLRPAFWLVVAAVATGVWYASYPQEHRFIRMSAPGLSRTDMDTVDAIERLADGRPYAALAPQMVSAAALVRLGFERELRTPVGPRYPYAIPTGGELYQQYLRVWREPDAAAVVEEARRLAGVGRIFVAVPRAWDPRRSIWQRFGAIAERRVLVDGEMEVFMMGEGR